MKKPFAIMAALGVVGILLWWVNYGVPNSRRVADDPIPEAIPKSIRAAGISKTNPKRPGMERGESAAFAVQVAPGAMDKDLPQYIKELMSRKGAYPTVASVEALRPNDESLLLKLYDGETELTNKMALTWALAAVGGDASAHALEHTLTGDYGQKRLSNREWIVLRDTMVGLGFIAERSDAAYNLLIEGLSDDFWKQHRTWVGPDPAAEAFSNRRFVGLALQSLGESSRPGVLEKLLEFKLQEPETIRGLSGAIVDTAFHIDIVKERGTRALLKMHLSSKTFEEFTKWTETAYGRNWQQWSISAIGRGL